MRKRGSLYCGVFVIFVFAGCKSAPLRIDLKDFNVAKPVAQTRTRVEAVREKITNVSESVAEDTKTIKEEIGVVEEQVTTASEAIVENTAILEKEVDTVDERVAEATQSITENTKDIRDEIVAAESNTPPVVAEDLTPHFEEIRNTTEDIDANVKDLEDVSMIAEAMRLTVKSISATVKYLNDAAARLEAVEAKTDHIETSVQELDNASVDLDESLTDLDEVEKQASGMQKEYSKAVAHAKKVEEDRDKAIAERDSATAKMLTYLIVLSVIGIGVSGALMFFGSPKMGLTGMAICAAVLVVAITVTKYFDYIAWGGLGILAIGAGAAIYHMFIQKKAIVETVETTELAKMRLSDEEKREVFGKGVERGGAHGIQSSSTMRLIESARRKMKRRIEPTIKHE